MQFGALYAAMSLHVSAAIIALVQGIRSGRYRLACRIYQRNPHGAAAVRLRRYRHGRTRPIVRATDRSAVVPLGPFVDTIDLSESFVPQVDSCAATAIHGAVSAPDASVSAWGAGQLPIRDATRLTPVAHLDGAGQFNGRVPAAEALGDNASRASVLRDARSNGRTGLAVHRPAAAPLAAGGLLSRVFVSRRRTPVVE